MRGFLDAELIVIHHPGKISRQTLENLGGYVQKALSTDLPVVVLEEGMTIEIVRHPPHPDALLPKG